LVKHIYAIYWMASGILTYLKEQQQYSPVACLLRYIEEEKDKRMCDYAVLVIKEINDPDLIKKLNEEKEYRKRSGKPFSPCLEALLKE
ncbi:MAG: hypothetical protein JXB88_04410, partial [Spirochaetales bacterium]|nr:hypothetical protein [Spirochaetales bacterium]